MTYGTITYAKKLAAEGRTAQQVWRGTNKVYGPIAFAEAEAIVLAFRAHRAQVMRWLEVSREFAT